MVVATPTAQGRRDAFARIIAVADSFDVVVSRRSYQRAISIEEAMDALLKESDSKLDKRILDALVRIIDNSEIVQNIIEKRSSSMQSLLS